MKMKKLFFGLWAIILLTSFLPGANRKMNLGKEKKILLEKDGEISKTSAEKGILKAFYPFLTDHSVLLPESGHPVYGKDVCKKWMSQVEIKGWRGKLKWEPTFSEVSAAGDLGYTHGRFERPTKDRNGNEKKGFGYYGTIWGKDSDGIWKVVFSQGLVLIKGLNQKAIGKEIDPARIDEVTRQVVATERAFSKYSVENGISEAFYRFIDDKGIALSPVGPPRTKETFEKRIAAAKKKKKSDSLKRWLQWEPIFSRVSASGDLAYNYGPYEYKFIDSNGDTKIFTGYFMTVWKRQPDKSWKFVFDGGN